MRRAFSSVYRIYRFRTLSPMNHTFPSIVRLSKRPALTHPANSARVRFLTESCSVVVPSVDRVVKSFTVTIL